MKPITPKPKIIIVDDNSSQAKLMQVAIERDGIICDIDVANNGQQCIDKINDTHYSAILLDYNLPVMNGLEVLEKLQKINKSIPVIMVTGEGSEEIAVKAMKRGAYDYIIKRSGYLDILPKTLDKAIEVYNLARELKHSELKYQTLVEMAGDAILVSDLDSEILIEANAKAIEMTGKTRKQLLATSITGLFASEDQHKIKKLHREIKNKGSGNRSDLYIARKDGIQIAIDLNANIVDFGDRKVIQYILRDVTEQRTLEQQISISRKRLQSVFDGITDMISVIDADCNIIMVNKVFAERCEAEANTLVGKKCYKTFFKSPGTCQNCPSVKTFRTEKPYFQEKEYEGKIYHIWSYPMAGFDGRPEFVVEQVKDVTDQKHLERQLIQSEKLATIGLLSSGIAHELRNPLSVIESARYFLEESLVDSQNIVKSKLDLIKRNIRRASAIINNLLEFSRKSGQDLLELDVAQVIENTLILLQKEFSKRQIELDRRISPVPKIYFNLDSLKQVFLNIIINAIQAMPDGGRLSIITRKSSKRGYIEIDFQDSGQGIAPDDLAHVFSPFFTTKDIGEGTGLGLYLSHSILKRENADIFVKSKLGYGSIFTVRLPIAKQSTQTQ